MTSIPADPSLVLGQIVNPMAIQKLMSIAKAQAPVDAANDRFNAKSLAYYQMAGLMQEMINMGMGLEDIAKIMTMKMVTKDQMVTAAMQMATVAIGVEEVIEKLRTDLFSQRQTMWQPESPISLGSSQIEHQNLSFDSLKFDVQYFRKQSVEQRETSMAEDIANHVSTSMSGGDGTEGEVKRSTSNAVAHSMNTTSDFQELEGTIVITCYCTHKFADIIAPLVIDADRAVSAWNQLMGEKLGTGPIDMWLAATKFENVMPGINTISVLTGVTRASSFVGMVHILKSEKTETSAQSVASSIRQSIEASMGVEGLTGGFGSGNSNSVGSTASNLLSTSSLSNTASLVCMGVIPDIKVSTVETVVKTMKPDPAASMAALGAIQGATNGSVNTDPEAMAAQGKAGAQYKSVQNTYLEKTVSALDDYDKRSNSVIDTNTMFTAFESYVTKVTAGEGVGVPSNFFLTHLTKSDVAKAYIRKYYPNGATGKAAQDGKLGLAPKEGGDGDK
mmetsp:Transcript_10061/g.14774  ORF Transcript_10061/g.14774 Transcript_10061/m.14774 type:complete len:503 (-) Transcript_10061:37-1545(-)